jgi:hypothetical protein
VRKLALKPIIEARNKSIDKENQFMVAIGKKSPKMNALATAKSFINRVQQKQSSSPALSPRPVKSPLRQLCLNQQAV